MLLMGLHFNLATHGGHYSGDIAIDDTKLLTGACSNIAPITTPTPTTLPPTVDRFTCDFETGWCNLTQVIYMYRSINVYIIYLFIYVHLKLM